MKAPITTAQAMSHPDVALTLNTLGKIADELREERDQLRSEVERVRRETVEACAKICDDLMNTNADGSIRDGIRQVRVKTVYAAAIRGGA